MYLLVIQLDARSVVEHLDALPLLFRFEGLGFRA
jgi:hypothetical protein